MKNTMNDMIDMIEDKPIVLILAGHDPSGGAGIQADTESIIANHCQPVSVITVLTEQSLNQGVQNIIPQKPEDFKRQAYTLLEEMDIAIIKIGAIGSQEILHAIIQILEEEESLPVVFDPIIHPSSGTSFSTETMCDDVLKNLIPLCTVITPNSIEARDLTQQETINQAAERLLQTGCPNVLITGTHEEIEQVHHQLYMENNVVKRFNFPRLDGEYHGSGCTLTSVISAQLALNHPVETAVGSALEFCWQSLKHANYKKNGRYIPNRFYAYDKI